MENISNPVNMNPQCNFSMDFYYHGSSNRTDLNCTPPEDYFFYADLYVVLPVIYSVICAVGLTGNTAVIYVILKAPKMKTVTNMFILNLAIADDLFTLVLPINIAEHLLHYWPFGEVLCKIILSIDHYNIFSSIYFLTVMSVDRYLVVLATVRSKRMPYRTYRAAKIVSLCVWVLVILIVVPFTVFAGVYVSPDDSERKSCVLSFPSPEGSWFKASRIYTLILGFAIPVSTICILYTMMLYKLRNMRLNTNAKALDKAKKRVTVMVFIVLAVCLLSYANSCLNPFLYAFLDDSFRKAFKKIVRSSVIQEEPLLLRFEKSQLRWLGHLIRMPPGCLPLRVYQAQPTGTRPRGRPRTRWRDYISKLAWERLGVPGNELEEVVGDRVIWDSLLSQLLP
ncbi:hypothetical protein MHYP_G00075470 [Metynnis hypsauchen]